MKNIITIKILFLALLSMISDECKSQSYRFTKQTAVYSEITGGTTVNGTNLWTSTNTYNNIPIGFDFQFYDKVVTQLNVNCNGYVDLPDFNYAVNFFLANMKSKGTTGNSLSPVSYTTMGLKGSRIFKLQFKNAGFINSNVDSINLQLWLYETIGRVEVRIGPNSITSATSYVAPYTGPLVSLENWVTNELFYLKGEPSDPTVNSGEASLSSHPANGTVYIFQNTVLDTAKLSQTVNIKVSKDAFSIYPNPNKGIFSLDTDQNIVENSVSIEISNTIGKVVKVVAPDNTLSHQSIDVSILPAGCYFISIKSDTLKATKKLVIE